MSVNAISIYHNKEKCRDSKNQEIYINSLCKPNNNSEKHLYDSTEDSNFYQAILINHATNGTES